MDATDEFRFINTAAVTSSATSSSRRTRKGGSHAEDGASTTSTSASSTNSLRTVPVCVYNENRSFKLRFFWDKAFKLFHSHRPVYRAVSGINYQDCGTIGGAGSALVNTAPDGTSLVKLRSQSHQQLNRIVPLNGEMDFPEFRNHNGRRVVHPASTSGTTSRILHSTVSSASAKNSRRHLFYDDTNVNSQTETAADFIPVVVPRKKNRAFGGGGGSVTDCSPIYTSPKKHHQSTTHSSSGKPASSSNTLVNSSSISGGEKPQQRNSNNDNFEDDDDDEQESSCFFYYNNANGEYDNVPGIHVNNHHHPNNTTSCSTTVFPQPTTIRGSAKATHLHTANTNSHVILPSHNTTNNRHHHHSNVSATLSAQSSSSSSAKASATSSSLQRGAPVQLRRTQSSKSHHSSNETQQRHYCNNNSNNNHLKSASATATISSLHHPHNHRENKSLLLTSSSQKHQQQHQQRNVPSPTCSAYESWKSSSAGSSSTKSKRNRNCEQGQGGEGEDSSDTIGNDSGLDTWKRKKIGDGGGCGSEVVNSGESSGIVCTISQTIPFHNRADNIHSDEEEVENDYATVASEEEDYEEVGGGGGDGERDLDSIEPVEDQDKMRMMIENGSVMYDSLDDDTYSVVLPRMAPQSASTNTNTAGSGSSSGSSVNGNTTVVLINSCCDDVSNSTTPDHCQNPVNLHQQNNSSQSDTFNFSDYDVECMSEIDLNSEPGGSSAASVVVEEETNGGGGESAGGPIKYLICHSTSENELDSLDLAMFERKQREAASLLGASAAGIGAPADARLNGESCLNLLNGAGSNLFSANKSDDDRNSSLCAEAGGIMVIHSSNNNTSTTTIKEGGGGGDTAQQIHLLGQKYYGVGNSDNDNGTCSSTKSAPSTITSHAANSSKTEEIYSNSNWSDAGSEFEFVAGPTAAAAVAATAGVSTGSNRDIPMGHSPRGNPPDVEWEPYFCVLNQLDQTFTSYRSEEMSIFPGTPTRPRTQTNVFGENGISPTEIPRVRLDGGPNSIKCLINNAKWGMNTLMEEEEESNNPNSNTGGGASTSSNHHNLTHINGGGGGDYSSSSGSSGGGSSQRTNGSSNQTSPLDTSYDKACGSERRGSAPLTPLLGRETPSRFANFFSKRSFKSNPLKRTKSVTKLERKKANGVIEPESSGSILYPSRMRISRSHESLLAWTNNPVNSFVSNGMMSTMDLTAGDVSIRPLHPSILGQEFAFQVTTPTGSKYYTCSSAAERDSWVYAFRQAIRPRADEVRRRENSLKIWILEGKGMPSSGKHSNKRYFCELYLDDVLYARTCGKPRGEMLFWGEHFEFTQLPNCVQLITVVFFREGDKKRKKERNTCIGKVKIPVNTVTSRYLIEKWYPVLPDSTSSSSHSSKEKDHPSLRIKCKYQSVDILPLRCYKSFLQYVKDQYGPLSECLESVLSVKAKEDLASAMVHVLHHEGLAKEFIAELALQEILKSGDEKLTFRGNSIATKAMEAFLKLTGTEYLHATLGPFIEQFQVSEDLYDCEIDPMKLPVSGSGSGAANLLKNQQNLRMAVDTVWKAIMHSHTIFPMELRECFSHCREALKSAGKEELSDHLISASIFLRFLCPAILSPSLFNITNEYPSEKSARNLTLIAKVLQTLANFTRFQGKENYMEFINDFVEREASNMKAFLSCISSPLNPEAVKKAQKESRDKVPAGGFIDLGKYLSILSTLLSENVAKIAPKNDRFKHLQELLETIHKWLEQPANATNVSMFPFPHLPSPPPSGPPPPAPLGIPINHRFNNPLCNSNIANANNNNNGMASSSSCQQGPHHPINHQYQVPHHVNGTTTPIYAVSSVIHNNSNPNVKNISHVQMNMNGSCGGMGMGIGVPPYPLQLQIPHVNANQIGVSNNNNNNNRSGSQASSGYQSQSPVLEGDDKGKKLSSASSHIKDQINAHINNINMRATEMQDATTALTFNNPVFNRKVGGSQSVDDLSTVGMEKNGEEIVYPRRLARSSSSSDCEYNHSNISPTKANRTRGQQTKLYANGNIGANNGNIISVGAQQSAKSQGKSTGHNHHRLSRRSSAELLRKNHPYSSSSDEDSDSGLVNERDEAPTPHLPPRRNHINKLRNAAAGHRPVPDGSSNGDKSLEEYEREMSELRRAMEALQMKLSRAEERLFGNESPGQQPKRDSLHGGAAGSPTNSVGSGNGSKERFSRNSDESCKEMDQLLQRLLSAEEEMKREHDLLTALDKKQKLIEAQEQKIARLDSVNNQLLQALAQIRDSLQQQHVQQQQQKIQQQLLKQQQHLKNLANGFVVPPPPSSSSSSSGGGGAHGSSCNHNVNPHHHPLPHQASQQNSLNNNGSLGNRPTRPNQLQFSSSSGVPSSSVVHHRDPMMTNNCNSNPSIINNHTNNNNHNNTTKVLITSSSNESLSQATTSSLTGDISCISNSCSSDSACGGNSNRDSSAILGEQALKMLAELRSSSC